MNNEIGVLITYRKTTDLREEFKKAIEIGLNSCQLCVWDMDIYKDSKYADDLKAALEETKFNVTALWAGWGGPKEWNFTSGPATIGLVPETYRYDRMKDLINASDFAEKVGISKIITHAGFIPEDPAHPDFTGTVAALRYVVGYMKNKGQYFLFETGQETPVTMLRTIQAIGHDNIGINFDTANLILYGKANTRDALDVFGKYVMETHIKDGEYPTDGLSLGCEKPAGQGKANLPAVIAKLKELGFSGTFTIEREITGEQQTADIVMARDLITGIMKELG